jgi:hypothetical protein
MKDSIKKLKDGVTQSLDKRGMPDRGLASHAVELGSREKREDMNDIEANSGINSGHYHELLDRTHIASSYVQLALGEHPVLARHPELMVLYETAVEHLDALYLAVGQHDATWK